MSLGPDDDGQLRASDADRERVLASLRQHAADGRLEVDELAERIDATLRARTLGELRALTSDLPVLSEVVPPAPQRPWYLHPRLLQMLGTDVVFVLVWLLAGRGSFWPIWGFLFSALVVIRPARQRGPRPHPRHYDERLPGRSDGGNGGPTLGR